MAIHGNKIVLIQEVSEWRKCKYILSGKFQGKWKTVKSKGKKTGCYFNFGIKYSYRYIIRRISFH